MVSAASFRRFSLPNQYVKRKASSGSSDPASTRCKVPKSITALQAVSEIEAGRGQSVRRSDATFYV